MIWWLTPLVTAEPFSLPELRLSELFYSFTNFTHMHFSHCNLAPIYSHESHLYFMLSSSCRHSVGILESSYLTLLCPNLVPNYTHTSIIYKYTLTLNSFWFIIHYISNFKLQKAHLFDDCIDISRGFFMSTNKLTRPN